MDKFSQISALLATISLGSFQTSFHLLSSMSNMAHYLSKWAIQSPIVHFGTRLSCIPNSSLCSWSWPAATHSIHICWVKMEQTPAFSFLMALECFRALSGWGEGRHSLYLPQKSWVVKERPNPVAKQEHKESNAVIILNDPAVWNRSIPHQGSPHQGWWGHLLPKRVPNFSKRGFLLVRFQMYLWNDKTEKVLPRTDCRA